MKPLAGTIFFREYPDFDFQLLRAFSFNSDGGPDFGECIATAMRIEEGNHQSWYVEWLHTAQRLHEIAEDALAKRHTVSAREAFLRASVCYRTAEYFLRDDLEDERILRLAHLVATTFRQAGELFEPQFEPVRIPYENTHLQGYFFRVDDSETPRPTVIYQPGYDSYVEELYFAGTVHCLKRGYNVLAFEGPGQGRALREQQLVFRPDWDKVITPVVDFALQRNEVDPKKLVLLGRSFASVLVPRAAAAEHRFAALIADTGQFDLFELIQENVSVNIMELINNQQNEIADTIFEKLFEDDHTRFFFKSRMNAYGAATPAEFINLLREYTMKGAVEKIECPSLICSPEKEDHSTSQARKLYDALKCPKKFIEFSAEEGAGDQVAAGAPSLFFQKTFDWLDETIGYNGKTEG